MTSNSDKNTIIVLNGTSSSGKTTISNALVAMFGDSFLYMSVDNALAGVSEMLTSMYGTHLSQDDVRKIESEEWIEQPAVSLFHHTIGAAAKLGRNAVIDHVMIEANWLMECTKLLHGARAYLIGVRCPFDELARREQARGDRPIGLAAAQYSIVHRSAVYDLEVDTSAASAEQCAAAIIRHVSHHEPAAFRELWRRRLDHSLRSN